MSKTWGEIFPGFDDPVQGTVSSYRTAERECDDLKAATEACADEFDRVTSSDTLGELGGQAADQLITLIKEVDGSFQDLPPVFRSLADIFDDHETKLVALREKAATALALANTRWTALQEARDSSAGADEALERINGQIRSLENRNTGDDPAVQTELDELITNRSWFATSASGASSAVRDAEDDLELSRTAHGSLIVEEREMVEHTADRVKGVDLDDLKDPNRLLEIAGNVGKFFYELGESIVVGIVELVEAIANGEWMDALWRLSELIGAVLTVLAIVAVVVAIVASGGALGALIFTASAVLMGSKLLIDGVLAGTQHPHPDTGQPKTWTEVAVDGALFAVTLATAGIGTKLLGPSGSSQASTRSIIGNLKNLRTPTSAVSGKPLYGGAASSSIAASTKQLKASLLDDIVLPGTLTAVDAVKNNVAGASGLTTSSGAWTNPTLVDFASGSPMTTDGLAKIQANASSVQQFNITGPSFSPSVPCFQVCPS